ncbi:MAG TPA: 3-deoxy-D-manno-octulosonic acid transferase [Fimbriimonas sp.]|nr:3-deoxy-D-manno-octulosonic acid transferase [Fimbriimonas sp.]
MFLLYNLLLTILSPLWVPWMLWRSWRREEKPNWQERVGNYKLPSKGGKKSIWFHAVSVGEVIAAKPILKELRKQLPEYEVVLSVTTSSGHQAARESEPGLFDHLVYFPIDIARFQFTAMQRVRPKAVVVMETELWMNYLWAAKTFKARTILVNGRISDRSFPRSMKIRFFYRALLKDLDRALMQTELDEERIRALGATSTQVLGNCKFDQALEGLDADPREWRERLGISVGDPVLVVGSTRGEAEEELVLAAIRGLDMPNLKVVHAPRHIESVPALCERVKREQGGAALRSRGETGNYLVVDTYGELAKIYSIADVVIIGGGFENLGGQNIVQPLAHGKPVIHGPHMQNFRDPTSMADKAGAAICCSTAEELKASLRELFSNSEKRAQMGRAAQSLVRGNVGASYRYAKAIAHEVSEF